MCSSDLDEASAALVVEVALAANLVAVDEANRWVPTTAYDRWLSSPDTARWATLASAWRAMPRSSHTVADDRPMSSAADRAWVPGLRHAIVTALREQPSGTTVSAASLTDYLEWQRPRRSSHARDAAIVAWVREAEIDRKSTRLNSSH